MTKRDFRRYVDRWHFWVGISYFGLACVVVALFVNFNRVTTDQQHTQEVVAARHADVVANAAAQYTQCVKSIPTLTKINGFIRAVGIVHETLLRNALASHRATPPTSPLYAAQTLNIQRLRTAFIETRGVNFTVPTHAQCVALRRKLQAHQ